MVDAVDRWQLIFLISAVLFVGVQMFRGWRIGIIRQIINLLGLLIAYGVAILGGRLAVPILRPLGYPDFIVSLIAGSLLALLVYAAISTIGRLLFRRTNQQSLSLLRLGYGVGGSAIGMIFGFLTVWLVVLAIRLLGTVAETELEAAQAAPRKLRKDPGMMSSSMAHMKESLEQGTAGAFVQRIDPIPEKAYDIMSKIGRVVSSPDTMERFLNYPGAQELSRHPRIQALGKDASVSREVNQRNYLALLKNESIVGAVNDPEISALLRRFELEKALDYALAKRHAEHPAATPE